MFLLLPVLFEGERQSDIIWPTSSGRHHLAGVIWYQIFWQSPR
jgi:hypothetical protein